MLVDGEGMEITGPTDFMLGQVDVLPLGEQGQMLYLMLQDGDNIPGPYMHNGTEWSLLSTEELSAAWFALNALAYIDGAIAENTPTSTSIGVGVYANSEWEWIGFGATGITDQPSTGTITDDNHNGHPILGAFLYSELGENNYGVLIRFTGDTGNLSRFSYMELEGLGRLYCDDSVPAYLAPQNLTQYSWTLDQATYDNFQRSGNLSLVVGIPTEPAGENNLQQGISWDNSFAAYSDIPRHGTEQVNVDRPTSLRIENGFVKFDGQTPIRDAGDITIECNVFMQSGGTVEFVPYMEFTSTADRFQIGVQSNRVYVWHNGSSPKHNKTLAPPLDQWAHHAYTYNSTTHLWTMFINGIQVATWTQQIQAGSVTKPLIGTIGTVFIDKWQIVPGIKYTGAFTPAL